MEIKLHNLLKTRGRLLPGIILQYLRKSIIMLQYLRISLFLTFLEMFNFITGCLTLQHKTAILVMKGKVKVLEVLIKSRGLI
jgi:hypothetical protein